MFHYRATTLKWVTCQISINYFGDESDLGIELTLNQLRNTLQAWTCLTAINARVVERKSKKVATEVRESVCADGRSVNAIPLRIHCTT